MISLDQQIAAVSPKRVKMKSINPIHSSRSGPLCFEPLVNKRCFTARNKAVFGVIATSVAFALSASAATLLSSVGPEFPSGSAIPSGGDTFSTNVAPRGGPVPVPLAATTIQRELIVNEEPAPKKRRQSVSAGARSKKIKSQAVERKISGGPKRQQKISPDEEDTQPPEPADLSKDGTAKTALATTAQSQWTTNFGWSWFNKYYFRGVDILKNVSPDHVNSGVFGSKATLAYSREKDAFSVSFGYVESLGRQIPKGAAAEVPPNSGQKNNQAFRLPPEERYAEYDTYLAYTRTLIPRKLQGTVGFNHYHFSDGGFYQTSEGPIPYANEATLRFDYLGLPYVRPSISWAHDFDGFKGDFLEMKLDGGFDMYKRGNLGVRLEPYVAVSYDLKYNGEDNGWNALEFGLSAPIHLTDHFTLTFTGNYTKALADSKGVSRANDGFWAGIAFNAAWGGTGTLGSMFGLNEYKDIITVPAEGRRWEFSTGSGWRNFDYDFHHGSVSRFDTDRLYSRRSRIGQFGLATLGTDKFYDDGAVFTGTGLRVSPRATAANPNDPGTATFFASSSQMLGNAQVAFSTSDYFYRKDAASFSLSSNDQDTIAFPYISLDTEVWRSGTWSIRAGLLYSFSLSEGDSGVQLARLDSLVERTNRFGYVYALDAVSATLPPPAVVYNSTAYANGYKQAVNADTFNFLNQSVPQTTFGQTDSEVVRVATFVRTKVDVNAHDFSIPVTFRHDFGRRLHAEISAAAVLTVVNAEISTDVQRRALDNRTTNVLANQRVQPLVRSLSGDVGVSADSGNLPPGATIDKGAFPSGSSPSVNTFTLSQLPPAIDSRQPTPPARPPSSTNPLSGGKSGSNVKPAELPGKNVGRERYIDNTNDVLFGFSGSVSLVYDLNESGTLYAEVWGRYHWSEDMTLQNRLDTSEIDMSGFEGGIGVGVRF